MSVMLRLRYWFVSDDDTYFQVLRSNNDPSKMKIQSCDGYSFRLNQWIARLVYRTYQFQTSLQSNEDS